MAGSRKKQDNPDYIRTKQLILYSAAKSFAEKGFKETSVREIMEHIGLSDSALYKYFDNKNQPLDYMLEQYHTTIVSAVYDNERLNVLANNPTTDGILSCLWLVYPEGKEEYYLNLLCVLLQEQYRNPVLQKFVADNFILGGEEIIKIIIHKLIELNVILPEADVDLFAKLHACVIYTFASRMRLGIGDSEPGFIGKGMNDVLRGIFDLLFMVYSVDNGGKHKTYKDLMVLMQSIFGFLDNRYSKNK